jgi:hypothetical protein
VNNKNSYILYPHTDSSINKLGDLVKNPLNLISVCYNWDLYELLNYEDETNESNIKKITKRYSEQEKLDFKDIISYYSAKIWVDNNIESVKNMPFKVGTTISIPKNKVNVDIYSTLSNQIDPNLQFEAFLAKAYKDLLVDSDFKSINKDLKNEQLGEINKIYPDITVWIWCRSLFNGKEKIRINTELNGTIFNLTPFILNLNTNVNLQVGSFSFELNNLICYYDEEEGWKLKDLRETDKNYISKFSLDIIKNGEFKRNNFYFSTVISENDIIFIRFETLKNEINLKDIGFKNKRPFIKNRLKNQNKLIINPEEIPGNIYDMIGLVDSTTQSVEPTNLTFSVQGRDLKKLLIEDGCYFYPIEFIPGGIFSNEVEEDYLERIDGKLINLTQGAIKTISYTLKFIINNLAKIKICDEGLFKPYRERISKTFRLDIQSRKEKDKKRIELFDFRKKILTLIHSSRNDDGLEENFNLDDFTFDKVKNFLLSGKGKGVLTFDGKDFKWGNFNYFEGDDNIQVKNMEMPISLDDYLYPKRSKKTYYNPPTNIMFAKEIDQLLKYYTLAYNAFIKHKNLITKASYINYPTQCNLSGINKVVFSGLEFQIASNNRTLNDEGFIKLIKNKSYTQPSTQNYYNFDLLTKDNNWEIEDTFNLLNSKTGLPDVVEMTKLETEIGRLFGRPEINSNIESRVLLENLGQGFIDFKNKLISKINAAMASSSFAYKWERIPKLYKDLTSKQNEILKLIWEFISNENLYKEFVETYTEQELKGIWKIIKLVVEDTTEPEGSITGTNIGNRRICDSSIGNENGNLLTSIQKICQQPFVEFVCDTYGDQYYFLAYQPPYIEKSWKDLMNICSFLTIDESEVLNEKLQFNTDSSYSWYKIRSQNAITDLGEGAVSAYLKAVHFKEYSDIWGEKPLEIVSNYLEYHSIIGDKSDLNIAYMIRQHLYDLKYIVDINSYLPFTRKGTITINGDRRIKVGSIIHYNPTGEVFMVDSVTQNFQNSNSGIDRTTVLQVSRGMVKKYIDLYFHIIDTPINEHLFYNNNVGYYDWVKILYENWKVNKAIFRFFLLRKQFSDVEAPKINTFEFKNSEPNWWENINKISNIK